MISLQAHEQAMSGFGAALFAIGAEASRASRILDYAEYHDGNGDVQQWKLRKPLGHYPAGAIIPRSVLDRLLFDKPIYGAVILAEKTPADIAAIE